MRYVSATYCVYCYPLAQPVECIYYMKTITRSFRNTMCTCKSNRFNFLTRLCLLLQVGIRYRLFSHSNPLQLTRAIQLANFASFFQRKVSGLFYSNSKGFFGIMLAMCMCVFLKRLFSIKAVFIWKPYDIRHNIIHCISIMLHMNAYYICLTTYKLQVNLFSAE